MPDSRHPDDGSASPDEHPLTNADIEAFLRAIPLVELRSFVYLYHAHAYAGVHCNPEKCAAKYHNLCASLN